MYFAETFDLMMNEVGKHPQVILARYFYLGQE
jgi:hypothetical protein